MTSRFIGFFGNIDGHMKPSRQDTDAMDMVGVLMGYDDGIELGRIKALGMTATLDLDARQTRIKKDLGARICNPDGIALAPAG